MSYRIATNLKCMIVDAEYFVYKLSVLINEIFEDVYKNDFVLEVLESTKCKNPIIEMVVAKSIADVFTLPVVHDYLLEESILPVLSSSLKYRYLKEVCDRETFKTIDRNSLSMFDGAEVVVFLRNKQIYILSHNESRYKPF